MRPTKNPIRRRSRLPISKAELAAIARGEWNEIPRRAFTPSQSVALARAIEPLLKEEGRRRQAAAGCGKRVDARHDTREVLGRLCGLSGKTIAKAREVVEAAEANPARYGHVLRRMDETGNVEAACRLVGWSDAARILKQPPIFSTTTIGNKPLGKFTAAELRWLISFLTALGGHIGATHDNVNVSRILTAGEVRRAIARANDMREAA